MGAASTGSPAANVAEAKALLRFTSLHGQAETDVRAFSADVRAAVRDSMESLRSTALSNPSTRAPSLEDTRTVLLAAPLPCFCLFHVQRACVPARLLRLPKTCVIGNSFVVTFSTFGTGCQKDSHYMR